MVRDFLLLDSSAVMNTRRELEWNAWEEKPISINATEVGKED